MKTQLKNRIHGVLLRYNLCIQASDLYGDQGESGTPFTTGRVADVESRERAGAVA